MIVKWKPTSTSEHRKKNFVRHNFLLISLELILFFNLAFKIVRKHMERRWHPAIGCCQLGGLARHQEQLLRYLYLGVVNFTSILTISQKYLYFLVHSFVRLVPFSLQLPRNRTSDCQERARTRKEQDLHEMEFSGSGNPKRVDIQLGGAQGEAKGVSSQGCEF